MRLDSALTDAASGLDAINRQLATVAQNVANAGTAGYSRETLAPQSVAAGGDGMGVRSGVATRTVDAALQQALRGVGDQVAGGTLREATLAGIDAASGAPGAGQDLSSLLGALRDGFSTLQNDPANQTQQRQVVNQAAALAQGVNGLGQAIGDARQSLQDGLVADVATANAALRTVGQLSDQIIGARIDGQSTADLDDKRDAAMDVVGQLTGARFLAQPNGDVLAVSGGTVLQTRAATGPLAIAAATLGPDTPPAAVPALRVNGSAAPLAGGRIGAALDLRDTVLPGLQAGLDGFAQGLAATFAGQGLVLFTDPQGAVPPAGTQGLAQTIQVNPAVRATPAMLRDGAGATTAAGDTTLIGAILKTVLGTGSGTLAGTASDLVATHANLASEAAGRLATDQAIQTSLGTKLDAATGVSVDTELSAMVRLQNSYGANAKVVATVQAMWTQLLNCVP